jgi:hypothetical protein
VTACRHCEAKMKQSRIPTHLGCFVACPSQ